MALTRLKSEFDFDWNNYRTIATAEKKLAELEHFLQTIDLNNIDQLNDQQELGRLCYKIGTFYNHIKRNPDLALASLLTAEKILKNEELAWVQNHIAFSYQQKLAIAKRNNNKEAVDKYAKQAFIYCKQAKGDFDNSFENKEIKIAAFTYCLEALIKYELGNLKEAIADYRMALDYYEEINELDDQYARAKNRWAMMLAENKQTQTAEQAFKELADYWETHEDNKNPYPARFYVSYGDHLMKTYPENPALALDQYNKAYAILCITDGLASGFTKDIHKKIVAITEKQDNQKKSSYSPMLHGTKPPATESNTTNHEKQLFRNGLV